MDCEKVRDRFSSLWEKDLLPIEEKIIQEHLSSCPKCQREFEQFEKTMRWLHSVGEVEVPEGFLLDLYKKVEARKRVTPGEKRRGLWPPFPLSFKLPAQAAAMVAVIFLVLYLTKMIPMEGYRPKEAKQPSSPFSVEKKSEQVLTRPAAPSPISEKEAEKRPSGLTRSEPSPSRRGVEGSTQKEMEGERRAMETFAGSPHPKDSDQARSPVLGENKREGTSAPEVRREAKNAKIPSPKAEIMAYQQMEPRGAEGGKTPSPERGKIKRELAVEEKSLAASKTAQEIILKISDRQNVIARLHELVKQFGGEVVTSGGELFVASLPTGSFSEFEKELARFVSSAKTDQPAAKAPVTGTLGAGEGMKREEVEERSKGPAKPPADLKSRTIVHILLVPE